MAKSTTMNELKRPKQKLTGKNLARKWWNQKYLQFMVIPGLIWMLIFNYLPMGGIIIAFKKFKITRPISEAPWVGLKYFKDFFQDIYFADIMTNTIGISLLKLIIGFPMPIIFALLLNEIRGIKFKKISQTLSYLPHFLSWVVLGGILTTWLSKTGVINDFFMALHIIDEPKSFLGDPKVFWGIALISDIWKELGWSAIIYLAAIAGVDQQIYEAATVDGANKLQKILLITLPCITGTIAIMLILQISGLLNSNFDQILILKNQVNISRSQVIDTYVYQVGMTQGNYSYATAVGLFKSVIALFLLLIANKSSKKLLGRSLY
ncbi:carbohydrate ABC transporter membrane protein 1, CUT1 family (TC 3.A.1.1.-) [Anaerocolumna jejuensis DSM 15929]|uniref:Carbohydrate ABC transporter membrane protein 1, CUT1 family (TC 3.A.1.1.-) n=1 Tax=Anaerocolumna jejuensis DSM 15929 TaxID=1121322 RepID=A0A1M6Z2X6_9FIRM|nr:ABC transporter permease subunit [Anaerocolumna jejuensis]SHL24750.1 carbohydrate ABC transporter membrane protein 1, CUT1 family (TC 3.A.1.1.-) [Anaerocolumna jejuensis DSM 15929]